MRDLPDAIPQEIREMIKDDFGTLEAVSKKTRLPYDTVRSVFVTGSSRAAETLKKLGTYAWSGGNAVGKALMSKDKVERKRRFLNCYGVESPAEIARFSELSEATISRILNADENLQITNLMKILIAFNMRVEEWEYIYEMELRSRDLVESRS